MREHLGNSEPSGHSAECRSFASSSRRGGVENQSRDISVPAKPSERTAEAPAFYMHRDGCTSAHARQGKEVHRPVNNLPAPIGSTDLPARSVFRGPIVATHLAFLVRPVEGRQFAPKAVR